MHACLQVGGAQGCVQVVGPRPVVQQRVGGSSAGRHGARTNLAAAHRRCVMACAVTSADAPMLLELQPNAVEWCVFHACTHCCTHTRIRRPATRPHARTAHQHTRPAHQPLAGCEAGSFAEGTITVRLPAIVGGTLEDMEAVAAASSDAEYAAQVGEAPCLVCVLARVSVCVCVRARFVPRCGPTPSRPFPTPLAAQLRAAATAIDAMRSELLTASASCPADLVAPAGCDALLRLLSHPA